MEVKVFTDGACSGNPGPGGWGAILKAFKDGKIISEKEIYGGEQITTNNRMELLAAIKALETLKRRSQVTIITDSKYLRDGMTKWLTKWLLNNWKNSVLLDAHLIASPLQGNTSLNTLCGYKPSINLKPMVSLYEWRTQQHLDSAFKDLPENPQNIYIEGSIVNVLPDTYNGHRLGHNWSISWVAERILKQSS